MAADLGAILPLPAACADAAFAPLAGESPVVRVARTMLGEAVIAVAAPFVGFVRDSLARHGLSAVTVVAADNPGTRAQCLLAGLQALTERARHVLIHDVTRPLTPVSLRDRVIDALQTGGPVVMPLRPVTDSVKTVDARGTVTGTLDRTPLRAVQYPRGFAVDRLTRLLAERTAEDFDELEAVLRTDTPITAVDGDADAFVVELPLDTAYVEAIITCRHE